MSIDFAALKSAPRILMEVALKPVQGTRFQPTGFPDLGAALYEAPDGKGGTIPTCLVQSAQAMANLLEAVCWDEGYNSIVDALKGLPYVLVKLAGLGDGTDTTTSLQEFHRLNSPYILQKPKDSTRTNNGKGKWFREEILSDLQMSGRKAEEDGDEGGERTEVEGVVNLRTLAKVCFKYDPNSLVHGVFLEKIAGRLRHPRALSAFIEASGAERVDSGGVKFDRALPSAKIKGLDAKEGFGNVPFHRTEFTAQSITAYFNIDLAQIRGYGLPGDATNLLIALSLWKIRQFLDSNMRLRTACELELLDSKKPIEAKLPVEFALPTTKDFGDSLTDLIDKCAKGKLFANPCVTELTWNNGK